MKKVSKLIAGALVVTMALSLCACKKKEETSGNSTITWWTVNNLSAVTDSYDNVVAMQKLQEKFDVDIEFYHPPAAQESEQFNVMAASGEFKDIVNFDWNQFSGGPVKAAQLGAIASLDDYLKKSMPNYAALLEENETINYLSRAYDSKIYVIPTYTDNLITESTFGPQIRKDWLDKLGLEVPTTFDEWHTVLTAFKTQDPNGNGVADEVPFVANSSASFLYMSSAFGGANQDFYIKDGKVVFGFAEPEYKEFLKIMSQWYKEGLIEKEYAVGDSSTETATMVSDKGGAFVGYCGSRMSKYMTGGRETNPNYTLVATQWPTVNKGDTPYAGYQYQNKPGSAGKGLAFYAKNKNLEKTLEVIDYLYSEEGSDLFNWGVLDETYTVKEDGSKQYTDLILKNPDGKTPVEAICAYSFIQYPIVYKNSEAYIQMNSQFVEQADAMQLWAQADVSNIIPSLAVSPEGQAAITEVMDDIYNYRAEWLHKFIMGKEPIEKWDEVAATIREMGIQKACDAYQEAYDRYVG